MMINKKEAIAGATKRVADAMASFWLEECASGTHIIWYGKDTKETAA